MRFNHPLRGRAFLLLAAICVAPEISRGRDGIVMMPEFRVLAEFMSIEISASIGGEVASAKISQIAKGSPAEERGMLVGDELISVDGVDIEGMNYSDLREKIEADLRPGQSVRLTFRRTGTLTKRGYRYVFTILRGKD